MVADWPFALFAGVYVAFKILPDFIPMWVYLTKFNKKTQPSR
uniref:Uncharacterized protein n=1 Tax=virus sp. ctoYX9 TaxID=2825822 RepID=A0A8S5RP99_9VIRU|nr:MAG TPA: hypothetical protein [virus sp. ctoYX9]